MTTPELFQHLKELLPKAFDQATYFNELQLLSEAEHISASVFKRLKKAPTKIQLHWTNKTVRELYTFSKDYSFIDLISAWSSRLTYLSHHSAMYFNDLHEQQPKDYYFTHEIASHRNAGKHELNAGLMKQAFMKDYRVQQNLCIFNAMKFFFIEKANVHEVGVETKSINFNEHDILIRMTRVERTLLDSLVSPQYSGGIATVIAAFERATIDLVKLRAIYNAMGFLYPYWQSIGFILDLTKGVTIGAQWASYFSKPKVDFYLDRNFRSDWAYSEKWQLYAPKGVLIEN